VFENLYKRRVLGIEKKLYEELIFACVGGRKINY
jgi:hypothetical protein